MLDDPSGRSRAPLGERTFTFDRVLGSSASQSDA
jgi:hypothetical protein